MPISAPKYKISYLDGTDIEVQSIPWDRVQAGRKFPKLVVDADSPDFDALRVEDFGYYTAWLAAVRTKAITDTAQRQKFDAWMPLVADVETLDDETDDDSTADPLDPTAETADIPEEVTPN